jgi:hypothetical protein
MWEDLKHMSTSNKNIIRYLIGLWIVFSAIHGIQYFFQERATEEESLVIAARDLDGLQEFNYSSDLFEARCVYKYSFSSKGTFVCPLNELSESIEFQIRNATILGAKKIVFDYCTKRRAMIDHLQSLREYVIRKDNPTDTIDIEYFRDIAFLLYDYIDAIRKLLTIGEHVNIESCL